MTTECLNALCLARFDVSAALEILKEEIPDDAWDRWRVTGTTALGEVDATDIVEMFRRGAAPEDFEIATVGMSKIQKISALRSWTGASTLDVLQAYSECDGNLARADMWLKACGTIHDPRRLAEVRGSVENAWTRFHRRRDAGELTSIGTCPAPGCDAEVHESPGGSLCTNGHSGD